MHLRSARSHGSTPRGDSCQSIGKQKCIGNNSKCRSWQDSQEWESGNEKGLEFDEGIANRFYVSRLIEGKRAAADLQIESVKIAVVNLQAQRRAPAYLRQW